MRGTIETGLARKKVYLDTNLFIYSVEVVAPWAETSNDFFAGLKSSEFSVVTSNLTLAECLVKPFKEQRSDLAKVYRQALSPRPYLNIAPIDDNILMFAAHLRAKIGLKFPDAIHAATAVTQQCTTILTNDDGFKRVPSIEVFLLSDWITPLC